MLLLSPPLCVATCCGEVSYDTCIDSRKAPHSSRIAVFASMSNGLDIHRCVRYTKCPIEPTPALSTRTFERMTYDSVTFYLDIMMSKSNLQKITNALNHSITSITTQVRSQHHNIHKDHSYIFIIIIMTIGQEIIEKLRSEAFNVETEQKLATHLYVKAAEDGTLRLAQKRAFCYEQFAIQRSDAISFAHLAGHRGFRPTSLTDAQAPKPLPKDNDKDVDDLFQFLLGGELFAAPMLLRYAASLGLNSEQALSEYATSPLAQAYPSYWARLALDESRAAGAAACAVNFPAWGRMCGRLYDAAEKEKEGGDDSLDFIKFFATPIENLDQMAAAVIDGEAITIDDYEEIKGHVRLLQEYEVLFWDAIYAATD
jgi:hypothetical protein